MTSPTTHRVLTPLLAIRREAGVLAVLPDVSPAPMPGPAVAASVADQVMLWRELKTATSKILQKLEPLLGLGLGADGAVLRHDRRQ